MEDQQPTDSPVTDLPTQSPVTDSLITNSPTKSPATASPTSGPMTQQPTIGPITNPPTQGSLECLMVATNTTRRSDGPLNVFVDSGSGYVLVSTPGKSYFLGEVVLDECFRTISGVQISNFSSDGWTGSIELSTDGSQTYSPMACVDCTGTTNTMPVIVEGDSNSKFMATTWCLDGATCTLRASTGV